MKLLCGLRMCAHRAKAAAFSRGTSYRLPYLSTASRIMRSQERLLVSQRQPLPFGGGTAPFGGAGGTLYLRLMIFLLPTFNLDIPVSYPLSSELAGPDRAWSLICSTTPLPTLDDAML